MRVLCFSGGPDSLCAVPVFRPDVLVHCNLELPYSYVEELCARRLAMSLRLNFIAKSFPTLSDFEQPNHEVPLRNLFLVSTALLFGRSGDIIHIGLAVEKGTTANESHDRDTEFFLKASELLSHMVGRLVLVEPVLRDLTKTESVRQFISSMTAPFATSLLLKTTSCYNRRDLVEHQCGDCPACIRRFTSFSACNLTESYRIDPWKSPTFAKYVERAKQGDIEEGRGREILRVAEQFGVIE